MNYDVSNILGVEVETINLPIFPGKNITVISEVIALNYLCKHYGYDAAKTFGERLNDQIRTNKEIKEVKKGDKYDRIVKYFEHDFE